MKLYWKFEFDGMVIKEWFFGIDTVALSLSFFLLGASLKNWTSRVYNIGIKGHIALLSIFFINSYFNTDTIDLALRRYDSVFFATISALIGMAFIIQVSVLSERLKISKKIFTFLGLYSLPILLIHEPVQRKLFNTIANSGINLYFVSSLALVISILVSILLWYLASQIKLARRVLYIKL